jgi:soluble lytic murein transglycosylase-like protein
MAIDSVNQVSNEQLLAMNMAANGQVTNDSNSTNSTSDESNLAFQLVMQNLTESSKKANQNNVATTSEDGNKTNNQATNGGDSSAIKNASTGNVNKAIQQYVAGQRLEDIPMILNNKYVNVGKSSGSILTNRSDADLQKIYNAVSTASKNYGVDSNLILAIIKQESDFDTNSKSESGAAGLMQIMPQNFDHVGITDEYDVNQNINGGTKLFKEYLNQYDGNTEMALMAYNGGPGTMQKRGVSSAADLYKMPKETQNYVPKVMGYYRNGV